VLLLGIENQPAIDNFEIGSKLGLDKNVLPNFA
jgi:hypothetical protein